MPAVLDHAAIRGLLPHGHPMLLIDRVVALTPGVSIEGEKAISGSEPCYRYLEPAASRDRFAYPTSLLLESFGQAAAILWLVSAGRGSVPDGSALMLAAARDCRIEGRAHPGDTLRHVARIDRILGDAVLVEGEVLVSGRRLARIGSMIAVMRPAPALRTTGTATTSN